jgi:hypothetical protein
MKVFFFVVCACVFSGLVAGCARTSKEEIPLSSGQTYLLQSSGKMSVSAAEGAPGSQPLHALKVKRKNAGASAATPGCWACTDCICNTGDCACTECTSC